MMGRGNVKTELALLCLKTELAMILSEVFHFQDVQESISRPISDQICLG